MKILPNYAHWLCSAFLNLWDVIINEQLLLMNFIFIQRFYSVSGLNILKSNQKFNWKKGCMLFTKALRSIFKI